MKLNDLQKVILLQGRYESAKKTLNALKSKQRRNVSITAYADDIDLHYPVSLSIENDALFSLVVEVAEKRVKELENELTSLGVDV